VEHPSIGPDGPPIPAIDLADTMSSVDVDALAETAAYRYPYEEDQEDIMDMDMDEEDDWEDEEDFDEDDEVDEDDEGGAFGAGDTRSGLTEFGGVEMITPRRMFRGARNIETVKDCQFSIIKVVKKLTIGNFLGVKSDKICSGSDDGNFFVWDKETGRLEGIWEGDGSVVNSELLWPHI
jgi:WD and tetratricopeptide repeat-containing protein 1